MVLRLKTNFNDLAAGGVHPRRSRLQHKHRATTTTSATTQQAHTQRLGRWYRVHTRARTCAGARPLAARESPPNRRPPRFLRFCFLIRSFAASSATWRHNTDIDAFIGRADRLFADRYYMILHDTIRKPLSPSQGVLDKQLLKHHQWTMFSACRARCSRTHVAHKCISGFLSARPRL